MRSGADLSSEHDCPFPGAESHGNGGHSGLPSGKSDLCAVCREHLRNAAPQRNGHHSNQRGNAAHLAERHSDAAVQAGRRTDSRLAAIRRTGRRAHGPGGSEGAEHRDAAAKPKALCGDLQLRNAARRGNSHLAGLPSGHVHGGAPPDSDGTSPHWPLLLSYAVANARRGLCPGHGGGESDFARSLAVRLRL